MTIDDAAVESVMLDLLGESDAAAYAAAATPRCAHSRTASPPQDHKHLSHNQPEEGR